MDECLLRMLTRLACYCKEAQEKSQFSLVVYVKSIENKITGFYSSILISDAQLANAREISVSRFLASPPLRA
ncbi:MAG: hypothetical protein HA496_08035 [Thaumarchaeota archaeon]|nr:hypothetical protein [Nitrososphaerota archaeon]